MLLSPLLRGQDGRAADLASFEQVWRTVHDTYWDPAFNGVDWNGSRDRFRPRIASASDRVVMATARKSDRVLVSADTDFGMLLARGRGRQPSVVLLRHGVERRPDLQVRLLRDVLPRVEQVLGRGAVVAVEPLRVRVRLLPIGRGGS